MQHEDIEKLAVILKIAQAITESLKNIRDRNIIIPAMKMTK